MEDWQTIEIVVRGVPGSGKTHIANAIRFYLTTAGINTRVEDPHEPPELSPPSAELTHKVLLHLRLNRHVVIRTECTRKG